ncbi:MAG: phospho-sugar mutase [Planctomycetes bacterium]|nr:phospho-sugar mutase [Planctomycetota bacterium]
MPQPNFDLNDILAQVEAADRDNQLKGNAAENIRKWLTEPPYADFVAETVRHVQENLWAELSEAFRTTIPFGTGGRRGRMYPIGTNVINDRTIGESAQGLADYVREKLFDKPLACAIAYDTRHRSREFAVLCSEIMVAAGFKVFFLDGYRSTPALSFAVRHFRCDCGIMVTASHNPPSDNAVKVYWSTGGQLVPPDDKKVIEKVNQVTRIRRADFDEALAAKQVIYCQEEVDAAFLENVVAQGHAGPRDVKIIYSPLHGVGESAVCPALAAAGFADVEVFAPHREPSGDFPNVPGHSSNPENAAVFDAIIERAQQTGAELILATDPDCDRVGVAVPETFSPDAAWVALTGNQTGALLTDYLLSVEKEAGTPLRDRYVVKTLVTTGLIDRIARRYGATTYGNLQVGFKWIGQEMGLRGPERFVFGAEESYGYLVGQYARDKDAAVISMLIAEMAARLKAEGITLNEKLDALFLEHGCHTERTFSMPLPGAEGMAKMEALMARFRSDPPAALAGVDVVRRRDYKTSKDFTAGNPEAEKLDGPVGDLVMFDLAAAGNYVAVRPSGTEPKVKFYMFTFDPPEGISDLAATKQTLADRLAAMEADLRAFAGG